jgi:hypothetical protein
MYNGKEFELARQKRIKIKKYPLKVKLYQRLETIEYSE